MDTQQPSPPETAETTPTSVYSELARDPLISSKKTLSLSWDVYKRQWKSYVGLVLLMAASFLIPFMAFIFTVAGGAVLKGTVPNFAAILGNASGIMVIIGALLFIPFILWLSVLSFTGVLLPGFADERASMGRGFKFTWHKFWSLLLVWILYLAIVLAGTILLIIPGIIWGIYYGMAIYACAFEDKRGMDALRRSKELVKGYVWTLLRRYSFWMCIVAISMFIGIIPVIGRIWQIIAFFVLTPVQYIYYFSLYLTLRERKNRGLATDVASGGYKSGTVLLLIGSIILLILIGSVSATLDKKTRTYPMAPQQDRNGVVEGLE